MLLNHLFLLSITWHSNLCFSKLHLVYKLLNNTLLKRVVFPALSNPNISNLTSCWEKRLPNILENMNPILK